jgi:hypothetical protein
LPWTWRRKGEFLDSSGQSTTVGSTLTTLPIVVTGGRHFLTHIGAL